jgi:hypothetical protein
MTMVEIIGVEWGMGLCWREMCERYPDNDCGRSQAFGSLERQNRPNIMQMFVRVVEAGSFSQPTNAA